MTATGSPTSAAPAKQLEFHFPTDLSVEYSAGSTVRITPAGPPRKWVRLRVAADRIGDGVDNRTVLSLGQRGEFSLRRVGGLWYADLLEVERYLTAAVI